MYVHQQSFHDTASAIFVDAFMPTKRTQYLSNAVSERLPCLRLLAWGEAFKEINEPWLVQLGTELRRAFADVGEDQLGDNGKELANTDPKSWINKFVVLQAMKTDPGIDELHFDGGASLIHMGLTLYGRRRLS